MKIILLVRCYCDSQIDCQKGGPFTKTEKERKKKKKVEKTEREKR